MIAGLVEKAEEQAEIERVRWEEQRRRWKLEERERIQREARKASTKELLSIIETWSLAMRIEAFLKDVETRASKLCDEESQRTIDRLQQARTLIGDMDSLRRFREWKTPDERC